MSFSVQALQGIGDGWLILSTHSFLLKKNHISNEYFSVSLRSERGVEIGLFSAIHIFGTFSDKRASESSLSWHACRNNRAGHTSTWHKFMSLPNTSDISGGIQRMSAVTGYGSQHLHGLCDQDEHHLIFKKRRKKSTKLRTFLWFCSSWKNILHLWPTAFLSKKTSQTLTS